MNVIKRDGKIIRYDADKIRVAIGKANEVTKELSDSDLSRITDIINNKIIKMKDPVDVEVIQDVVEDSLMKNHFYKTAKSYILYRDERDRVRRGNSKILRKIAKKINAVDVANQNANVDELSFGGRKGEADRVLMKDFALNYCMSKKSRENHLNNEIYIHDLDSYALGEHNCAEGESWIRIRDINDNIRYIKIKDFARELGLDKPGICDLSKSNYQIMSRNGWTKFVSLTRRQLKTGEKMNYIKTKSGLPLKLTDEHRLPVIRDGKEKLLEVKNIKVGDGLLSAASCNMTINDIHERFLDLRDLLSDADLRIVNITKLREYLRYKYDIIFTDYIRNLRGINDPHSHVGHLNIKKSEFDQIIKDFTIPFDVLCSLRIKACGSKHTYPLLIPLDENLAKLYGYIYADGSVYVNEKRSLYQLGFFNTNPEIMENFLKAYENVFGYRMNVSYPNFKSTSPCLRVTDGSRVVTSIFRNFASAFKYGAADISVPDFIMNGPKSIKYAFLSACIDTDGCMNTRCIQYSTCGDRYSEQLILLLQSLGYHPHKRLLNNAGSTYRVYNKVGKRNYNCYSVEITRNDDIKNLYKNINTVKVQETYAYLGPSYKTDYAIIQSMKQIDYNQDVFDIETGDHWYILNDYVSHNCLSIPFDQLLANGFNTRQTDVRPANSVNTAFQLLAVIFQLQSLQQFGGVSATHLDWTMVPYVRKSFKKHFMEGLHYLENTDDWDIDWDVSIEDDRYKEHGKAYKYAMDMTEKELQQAVEGMYHNLKH